MKHALLTSITLGLTLLSSAALAGNAIVSGPLGDSQLVRGKKLGMSYLHYGPSGADPGASVTVNYGFYGTINAMTTMSATGYGNRVAFIDVPANATGFVYTLSASDGTVQSNGGSPFSLPMHDRAVSVSKPSPSAATVQVRYVGPVQTTYDTYLHLGWNNWNAVGDAFMARTEFSYGKAGIYYDYDSVDVTPPYWANYLDFVFKDARGGGTWDNNGGADWHQNLNPFVTASANDQGTGTVSVVVSYQGGLSPVTLHYGTDGWQGVTDVAMQSSYGSPWQAYFTVASSQTTLDFAFTNGSGSWDNNYGANWVLALH